jgi:glycosyltransferase involved in cell wall biosynthesis
MPGPAGSPEQAGAALDISRPAWRASREAEQQAGVPTGRVAISCSASPGSGGLGRHSQEIAAAVERAGGEFASLSGGGDPAARRVIGALRPLVRFSPAWRSWADCVAYDRYAVRRLPSAEHLIAFNGESLAQLGSARRAGRPATLVSATAHMAHVRSQHEKAHRLHPIEQPWSARLLRRSLREYEQAGQILCSSRYVVDSFLERGVPERRLAWFPLTPDPRFSLDPSQRRAGEGFQIVYSGMLTVGKGVPLLIDAVRRLAYDDLRLVLVGGWGTRGMRQFVQRACAEDRRIEVRPGDPLEHLRGARLCVHPSWADGFGYAPAEALAAGVPAIVSEDTGMKELIRAGENGLVVATGDLDALTEAIDAAYRREVLGG